jgi:hypothetical protein
LIVKIIFRRIRTRGRGGKKKYGPDEAQMVDPLNKQPQKTAPLKKTAQPPAYHCGKKSNPHQTSEH